MSFGFGVGDFLAVIKLANDIRRDFADAPEQFQQITAEIRNLVIVLGDIDVSLAVHEVSEEQNSNINGIRESCHRVLEDSRKELSRYVSLESKGGSLNERTKRIWKRVKWEPDNIRDLRGRITANIVALNSFTGANIRDTVFKLEERQVRQENREILDWLTPLDPSAQQTDFISQRQSGTGQWLLESIEYINWKATKGEVLFFHGIPGAGKTICSSIVVENLQNTLIEADVATCYFYFNFKRQGEQTLENVLLSLLKQLCQAATSVPDAVQVLYDRCQSKSSRPSREEVVKTVHAVVGLFSRVLIVVDALDECQTSNGCQREVILHLIELQQTTNANIMATSRPVPHIVERFKGFSSVEVRANEGDIHRYIESNLQNLPGFVSKDKNLQDEVKEGITKAVDGMFLLAKLHLDSLKGKKSPRVLRQTLNTLATGNDAYDEAYQNTMLRISGQLKDQKELATSTLMWIVHAKRPLTIAELRHALGVEIGEPEFFEDGLPDLDDMLSACCGLVTVDEESRNIRLIHYTTQEFFERRGIHYFPDAETHITDTCVTYLAFGAFSSGPPKTDWDFSLRLTTFPLYAYSSQYWGQHAYDQEESEFIRKFLDFPSHVEACGHCLTLLGSWPKSKGDFEVEFGVFKMTGLHLAARFGLVKIASRVLNDSLDLDVQDSLSRSPIWYAARNGYQDVVRKLLDRNCQVNLKDILKQTPLHLAAQHGYEPIVRLLLDNGAQIYHEDEDGRTPLHRAAQHGDEAIVRLLLDKGARVDHADTFNRTPLHIAAQYGSEAAVRLLINNGAYIDHISEDGKTAVWEAASMGHDAIVRLLLDKGAYIDHADEDSITPLWAAAQGGDEATVRLLIDNGARSDHTDTFNRTPLWQAALGGHEAVVRLLMNHGAYISHADKFGKTPLHLAALRGNESLVRLLIDNGAHIDHVAEDGKTAVWEAADWSRGAIMRLLIDNGAQIDYADAKGRTPLRMAVSRGDQQVTKILIDHGAEINSRKPTDGSTPLLQAARLGRGQIIKLLLDAKADHKITDIFNRSAFMYAIIGSHPDVVDALLLHDGLDPNTRDHWGSTALSFAARFGTLSVFRKMAALPNIDILARDSFGRTPLWWARKQRHDNIIREIIEHQRFTSHGNTDAHTPAMGETVDFPDTGAFCDVCYAALKGSWFHCDDCADGDFDICPECHGLGARCLVESHELLISEEDRTSENEG